MLAFAPPPYEACCDVMTQAQHHGPASCCVSIHASMLAPDGAGYCNAGKARWDGASPLGAVLKPIDTVMVCLRNTTGSSRRRPSPVSLWPWPSPSTVTRHRYISCTQEGDHNRIEHRRSTFHSMNTITSYLHHISPAYGLPMRFLLQPDCVQALFFCSQNTSPMTGSFQG